MIHFPVLRTKIATITLREIPMIDAIRIAGMPVQNDESAVTAFLRAVVESATGLPDDVLDWTVEYRTLAVCHYLASVLPGGPDFTLVNGAARYSDYLDGAIDAIPASIKLGKVSGDTWNLSPLTGRMAESIERTQGALLDGRLHWLFGAMACQLDRDNEEESALTDGLDDWLAMRMNVLLSYTESDMLDLMDAFQSARSNLYHLFNMDFSETGMIVLPKQEGAGLPPARFPVHSCLSEAALGMGKWAARTQSQPDPVREHADSSSHGDD
jgi:hypothetical protein